MANLTSAQARKGETVTTTDRLGGTGIGYLVNGQVWATTGSYWAVKAQENVFGLARYARDGGAGYLAKVRKIFG